MKKINLRSLLVTLFMLAFISGIAWADSQCSADKETRRKAERWNLKIIKQKSSRINISSLVEYWISRVHEQV